MNTQKASKSQTQSTIKKNYQIKTQHEEAVRIEQNLEKPLTQKQNLKAKGNIGENISQNPIEPLSSQSDKIQILIKNTLNKSSSGFNKGTSFILQQAKSTIEKIKASHAHLIDSTIFQRTHKSFLSESKLTPIKNRPKSRATGLDGRLISKTINEHMMSTKYLDSALKSLDLQIQRSQENSPKGSPEKGKEQISKKTSNEDDYINEAARFTNKWYVKVRESVRDISNKQENLIETDSNNSKSTQTEVTDMISHIYTNPEFEKFVIVMYEAYIKLNGKAKR